MQTHQFNGLGKKKAQKLLKDEGYNELASTQELALRNQHRKSQSSAATPTPFSLKKVIIREMVSIFVIILFLCFVIKVFIVGNYEKRTLAVNDPNQDFYIAQLLANIFATGSAFLMLAIAVISTNVFAQYKTVTGIIFCSNTLTARCKKKKNNRSRNF